MKIVGKRKPATGSIEKVDALQRLATDLRGDKPFHPKGVFKFKTFEEKEAWDRKIRSR